MASTDFDFDRLHKDVVKKDISLRKVLRRVDESLSLVPPQRNEAEFASPYAKPPRVSPESILAEFEGHARSCEDILAEIRTMLKAEEESWEQLAAQYRELGQVQATAVHDMLARIATMRDVRTRLSSAIAKSP